MQRQLTRPSKKREYRSKAVARMVSRNGGMEAFGGPVAIVAATALMALQDAVVKLMSNDLPLWQFFFLRSIIILPLLTVFILRGDKLRSAIAPWALVRSGLIVSMYVWFYAGMPLLDLPVVSAVYYMGPIFIVLLSSWLLHEPMRIRQVLAVLVAFVGVLIVLRPSGQAFSLAALIPLVSALCYAVAAIVTRGRLGVVEPLTLTYSLNLVFVVVGVVGIGATATIGKPDAYPFLSAHWTPLGLWTLGVLGALAGVSIAIHLLLARAYQLGPTAIVAGLDFSYLGFAALWAVIIFNTVPDDWTVVGTILIGVGGLWGVLEKRG